MSAMAECMWKTDVRIAPFSFAALPLGTLVRDRDLEPWIVAFPPTSKVRIVGAALGRHPWT
jgi:hypothetical protein